MSINRGRLADGRGRPPPLHLTHAAPGSSPDDIPLHGAPATNVKNTLTSPISPSSPPMSPKPRRMSGTVPPPVHRSGRRRASATPPPDRIAGPAQRQALDDFAEACRAFFYDNDASAEEKMTRRLAALPSHEKRQYTKVQASIRAAFHRDAAARRKHEFRAHLTAVVSGASLSPAARVQPRGREAAAERSTRFAKFVETWCSPSFPGTSPFFDALWAVMSLQTLPVDLGGAGDRLLEWEIDDLVFMESAGKGFMQDAIDVLKGVLAFEAQEDSAPVTPLPSPQPLRASQIRSTTSSAPAPVPTPAVGRPRAISDPFLDVVDDTPGLSHSLPSDVSSPRNGPAPLPGAPGSSSYASASLLHGSSPATPPADIDPDSDHVYVPHALHHPEEGLGVILDGEIYEVAEEQDEPDRPRVWTAPDLPNHEYVSLLAAFPSFVTSRKLPRIVVPPSHAPTRIKSRTASQHRDTDIDLEAGELVQAERPSVRHGTGCIRVGERARSAGWKSTWWRRFVSWWQQMLC